MPTRLDAHANPQATPLNIDCEPKLSGRLRTGHPWHVVQEAWQRQTGPSQLVLPREPRSGQEAEAGF